MPACWGEITVHRYEAGALQDEIHNNELLLMKNPDNLHILFEKNKYRLSQRVANRLKSRLENLLHEKSKIVFHNYLETFCYSASEDIESGLRKVYEYFESFTATRISNYSHEEAGYKNSKNPTPKGPALVTPKRG